MSDKPFGNLNIFSVIGESSSDIEENHRMHTDDAAKDQ